MTVILPQPHSSLGKEGAAFAPRKYPTLYLLHGLSDDDTIWLRRTSIERYVEALDLAVIMPQVHRSFYVDMVHGGKYWTFLSEELPRLAQAFFPLSGCREDTFVAGLSMGGYGALKWALRHPERFAAAASLSGGVNRARMALNPNRDFKLVYGDNRVFGTENDLFWLLKNCHLSADQKPNLFLACGTEDFAYDDNVLFRDACRQSGFDYVWVDGPGSHEWSYWDAMIQQVVTWLPLPNR